MTKIAHVKEASLLLLENEKGEFLIQNRESISKAGELWGFFGGGGDDGETAEETLIREIQEELGFKITNHVHIGSVFSYAPVMDNHVMRNFFYAKTNEKIEDFNILEGDYAVYKTMDELSELDGFMWNKDAFAVIVKMLGAYKGT